MLVSDKRLDDKHGGYLPDVMIAIDISELVRFNANPVLSVMIVLKTIPSDSPQLTIQNETRAMRKYIDTVRCRFTATSSRENKRPEAISNGISRIRYTKKNESTEYALSAYSCRGCERMNIKSGRKSPPVPYKMHLVPMGIGQRSATNPQNKLMLRLAPVQGERTPWKLTGKNLLNDT
jgi:hypothetical protein